MERSNYFECSADQKFFYFNPHHFLVGLTKTKSPPDQNFGQHNQMAAWLSQPPQEIGSAYKIFMSHGSWKNHGLIYVLDFWKFTTLICAE